MVDVASRSDRDPPYAAIRHHGARFKETSAAKNQTRSMAIRPDAS